MLQRRPRLIVSKFAAEVDRPSRWSPRTAESTDFCLLACLLAYMTTDCRSSDAYDAPVPVSVLGNAYACLIILHALGLSVNSSGVGCIAQLGHLIWSIKIKHCPSVGLPTTSDSDPLTLNPLAGR
jgi:hypothetical protein